MVRFNPGADLTTVLVSGEVTVPELLAAYSDFLTADAGTSPNVLWDFSAASMAALSAGAIRDLASGLVQAGRGRRRPGRSALLCSREVDFGLARMLALLVEDQGLPVELRVFRDRDVARAWLRGQGPALG
jgi:hypothetical protein